MATGIGVNQGKTAFLEEFLPGNRDADEAAVNEAWRASGHEGKVSESLISKTRSRLKIPKTRAASGRSDGRSKAKGKGRSSPRAAKAEKTLKAEQSASKSEGRAGGTGANKTEFIREQLRRDNGLDAGAINRAWSEAGNPGDISDNLVYKTRASMGIKGRRATAAASLAGDVGRETSPKSGEPAAAPAVSSPLRGSNGRHGSSSTTEPTRSAPLGGGRGRELHEIEGEIDEMMFRLRGLGEFPEVVEALRTARRILVRSHGD